MSNDVLLELFCFKWFLWFKLIRASMSKHIFCINFSEMKSKENWFMIDILVEESEFVYSSDSDIALKYILEINLEIYL